MLAPWVLVGIALVLGAVVLLVARNLIARTSSGLAQRSKTRVDDILVKHMRRIVFTSASPAYTVDVLNAMASVMAHPDADPNRVGMWGHSMGGSITLRAMVVTDTIKAGVIWAGVTAPYPMIIQRWAERWADRRRLSAIGLWLEDNPVLAPWVLVGVALVLNAAVLLVARNLIARGLVYLAQRSKTRVDDILVKHMRPYRFAWLVPLLLTYFLATWVPQWTETAQTLQGAELGQHDHGRADAQAP